MNILIIKSSSMGDVVHALPVALDISEHFPGARIDWVAEESFRDIPALSPFVSRIIVTRFRKWQKAVCSGATWEDVARVKRELRETHYDIVIDLQGLSRTGLVTRWAGADRAAGFSFGTVREKPAALFYDRDLRFRLEETMGAVHRYRALAGAALGYEPEGRPRFGLKVKEKNPLPTEKRFAALAVNTSQDRKLWPEAHWIEVGRALRSDGVQSVLFWGSETEHERVGRIAAGIEGALVAPRMGLAQIAAVLSESCAVIGVDTGLSHLGAALARPTVGIYVDTETAKVAVVGDGPYKNLGGVGEPPSVSEVLETVRGMML